MLLVRKTKSPNIYKGTSWTTPYSSGWTPWKDAANKIQASTGSCNPNRNADGAGINPSVIQQIIVIKLKH